MLQTTDDKALSTQATENKKNQDVSANTSASDSVGSNRSIKNLSTTAKLAEFKKPNFAKTNSKTDFLTPEAKKAFIQKAFIKPPILSYYDPEYHIWIENNLLGSAIDGVLSQMTSDYSDQLSSDHMTHENLDPNSFKSKICQWHPIAFFS